MASARPSSRGVALAVALTAPACGPFDRQGPAPPAGDSTARPAAGAAGAPPDAPAYRPGAPPGAPRPRAGLPPGVLAIKVPPHPASPSERNTSVHAIALDATHLFFNDGFGRIWRARKDGAGAPAEVPLDAGPPRPGPAEGLRALHLIADGDDLFFTADASLFRVGKAGGPARLLAGGRLDPVMLAADEGFLYFSTFDGSAIRRVPRAGGPPSPVAGPGIKSGAIAVDATHLYVAAYGRGTLARVPKAGGRPKALAAGLPKPVGLALDDDAAYVSCEGDGSVRRVLKAGGPPKVLARAQQNHDALALDRDYVYWASWEEGSPLRRARKDGASAPETLLGGLRAPEGIAVDERYVYVANKGAGEVLIVPKGGVDGTLVYPHELPD